MRPINRIIVHHSDTPASMDIGAKEIQRWHVEDNMWKDIGYHYVIRRSGHIEKGRPLKEQGAHTYGHNTDSIGICLVGGKPDVNFTRQQWNSLEQVVFGLILAFGSLEIGGHRDFATTACPGFDVKAWLNEKEEEYVTK